MSEDQTPQEELKEKTWQAATTIFIYGCLFGAGFFVGYLMYGDAVELRDKTKQQQDRIVDLENERETMSTRMAKETRDREVCEKSLKAAGAAAPVAPPAP